MTTLPHSRILSKIEAIKALLDERQGGEGLGLYTGAGGRFLFRTLYHKLHGLEDRIEEDAMAILDDIGEHADTNLTFCTGLSGTLWYLNHLSRQGTLELDEDFFEEVDPLLATAAESHLHVGNYDFMHGAGGIMLTLLDRPDRNREALTRLAELLLQIRIPHAGYPVWRNFVSMRDDGDTVSISMGLSHGIPSMMFLLARLYQENILPGRCLEAIGECYAFTRSLLNPERTPEQFAYYPTMLRADQEKNLYHSRLAWCYGDMSIGISLYNTGRIIGNTGMVEEAEQIFSHYAALENEQKYYIRDGSFCHGAAGLAHLFRRMHVNTGRPEYARAADYWLQILLDMATYEDGLAGFKHYTEDGMENNRTMLEGIAGIGAVMGAAMLSERPDWDACFLLS